MNANPALCVGEYRTSWTMGRIGFSPDTLGVIDALLSLFRTIQVIDHFACDVQWLSFLFVFATLSPVSLPYFTKGFPGCLFGLKTFFAIFSFPYRPFPQLHFFIVIVGNLIGVVSQWR
jgi:hypothetical protein